MFFFNSKTEILLLYYEEYGGTDMGYLAHTILMEEMSRISGRNIGKYFSNLFFWLNNFLTAVSLAVFYSESENRECLSSMNVV